MVASSDPPIRSPAPADGQLLPTDASPPEPLQHPSPVANEAIAPTNGAETQSSAEAKPAPPRLVTAASPPPTSSAEDVPSSSGSPVTATTLQTDNTNETRASTAGDDDAVNPIDFQGAVDSDNELPSEETLKKIENYVVLDRHGKSHTFKSLYTGKHVARRVLIIFVRHFFCGNCQEYLRTLSASITPEALLRLPVSTFIAVIGCGSAGLIDMYASETGCPFPIYADPTRKLYSELGMIRTLALGSRPAYMKKSLLKSSIESVFQGLKQIKNGMVTKAGDQRQIGGEFLFEPYNIRSPITTPWSESEKTLGNGAKGGGPSIDGVGDEEVAGEVEEKRVSWCHRMKTTRDHAEIPELMEVLGLDGQGIPIDDEARWTKALEQRKGTGLSMASQMSALKNTGAESVSGEAP